MGSSPIPRYCNHEIFETSDPNARKTHPFDTGTTPKKPWSHKVDSYEVRLSKHFESAIERMNRELPPEHRHAGMRWTSQTLLGGVEYVSLRRVAVGSLGSLWLELGK